MKQLLNDEFWNISTSTCPDEVLRLTDGQDVDLVLEVGGQGTLSRSIASARKGGTIALIGGVSGFGFGNLLNSENDILKAACSPRAWG